MNKRRKIHNIPNYYFTLQKYPKTSNEYQIKTLRKLFMEAQVLLNNTFRPMGKSTSFVYDE